MKIKRTKKDIKKIGMANVYERKMAELDALERFRKEYPDLRLENIKTINEGNGEYVSYITIKEQVVSYGNSY